MEKEALFLTLHPCILCLPSPLGIHRPPLFCCCCCRLPIEDTALCLVSRSLAVAGCTPLLCWTCSCISYNLVVGPKEQGLANFLGQSQMEYFRLCGPSGFCRNSPVCRGSVRAVTDHMRTNGQGSVPAELGALVCNAVVQGSVRFGPTGRLMELLCS